MSSSLEEGGNAKMEIYQQRDPGMQKEKDHSDYGAANLGAASAGGKTDKSMKAATRALKICVCVTLTINVLLFVGFFVSHSLTLLSEGFHMMVDSAMYVAAIASEQVKHKWGPKSRSSQLLDAVCGSAFILCVLATQSSVAYQGVRRLVEPDPTARLEGSMMLFFVGLCCVGNGIILACFVVNRRELGLLGFSASSFQNPLCPCNANAATGGGSSHMHGHSHSHSHGHGHGGHEKETEKGTGGEGASENSCVLLEGGQVTTAASPEGGGRECNWNASGAFLHALCDWAQAMAAYFASGCILVFRLDPADAVKVDAWCCLMTSLLSVIVAGVIACSVCSRLMALATEKEKALSQPLHGDGSCASVEGRPGESLGDCLIQRAESETKTEKDLYGRLRHGGTSSLSTSGASIPPQAHWRTD
uniref:Cation efflux protein transmembrane domain-containing protein n=1 Tax=Chromera velia CCMP2878 TaxID=1169474 RepID=A0A0G4HTF2_9ALVE|eukprot:Cvel_31437.t1-p1 / transcript=Cvel_31437.t1 / gene=Cvel_31437 / organism=Chromera_velia_CCMP2878 / gene_product=hypothetical protein / transcript_product=hypothetical protein / location=Cvel_scaffold4687:402-3614(-) / protein_length=417 / sequence_SO=supercontig / SO=protein_coding / is_pseudo=false